jgi:hypothetical protein
LLFEVDAAGIHRPVCADCRRGGEALHGWPGPNGGELVPIPRSDIPGFSLRPNPVAKPFPTPVMVPNIPSVWSPRPSSGPGVRKYPR